MSALSDLFTSFWQCEEATGATRIDIKGTNNLASNNGVVQAAGKVGFGADFEKDSSMSLSIASNATLQMGDIACFFVYWVKFETTDNDADELTKDDQGVNREYLAGYSQTLNRMRFGVFDAATGLVFTQVVANNFGTIPAATWLFVAQWHDPTANTLNIQVNNGTVDSLSYSGGIRSATAPFALGNRGGAGGANFTDGVMDQVGFGKAIPTAAQLTQLYNGGAGMSWQQILGVGGTLGLLGVGN